MRCRCARGAKERKRLVVEEQQTEVVDDADRQRRQQCDARHPTAMSITCHVNGLRFPSTVAEDRFAVFVVLS